MWLQQLKALHDQCSFLPRQLADGLHALSYDKYHLKETTNNSTNYKRETPVEDWMSEIPNRWRSMLSRLSLQLHDLAVTMPWSIA
jgi:hypothetical protein